MVSRSPTAPARRSATRFADHFSRQAGAYAAFRPTYPRGLIARLAGLAPGLDAAWDCATGNGQAALLLAAHFAQVLATDASREQLARAVPHPQVVYREALADDSGAPSASVDLITVAQALHWFDLDGFYDEARRVLRPNGVLAVWCYGAARVSPEIDRVLDWFYTQRVGRHWPLERRHVEAGYRDLTFPFAEVDIGAWSMTASLDRRTLIGYVGTWSAVGRTHEAEGGDPLVDLATALAAPRPDKAATEPRTVTWPLGIRVGRQ